MILNESFVLPGYSYSQIRDKLLSVLVQNGMQHFALFNETIPYFKVQVVTLGLCTHLRLSEPQACVFVWAHDSGTQGRCDNFSGIEGRGRMSLWVNYVPTAQTQTQGTKFTAMRANHFATEELFFEGI